MTLEDEHPLPPRSEDVQYATEEEQRALANSSSKTAVAGPKRQQCSGVGVSGGGSKVRCCKEQYCIGTWNVRSMNTHNSIKSIEYFIFNEHFYL